MCKKKYDSARIRTGESILYLYSILILHLYIFETAGGALMLLTQIIETSLLFNFHLMYKDTGGCSLEVMEQD